MVYSLNNKCANNFCKRTILVQLIVFLEHSVYLTWLHNMAIYVHLIVRDFPKTFDTVRHSTLLSQIADL